MHHFRTATPEALHGKTVLLSCVPNAQAIGETLAHYGACGAKWVLLTQRGQPNGRFIPELSTEPLAAELQDWLTNHGQTGFTGVQHVPDTLGRMAQSAVQHKPPNSITVLENVDFLKEHQSNMHAFAQQTLNLISGENGVFVLDDFTACQRPTGSTVGLQKHMPSYIGQSIALKVKAVEALKAPEARHKLVLAGANVAQNLELLEHLLPYTALVAAEGATAHTLMAAKDMPIGKSSFDATQIPRARNVLVEAGILGCRVLLPTDAITGVGTTVPTHNFPENQRIMAVGESTLNVWQKGFSRGQSVLWRGLLAGGETPNRTFARALQAHKITPTLMRPKQVTFYQSQEQLPFYDLSEDAVFTLLTGRVPLGLRPMLVEQAALQLGDAGAGVETSEEKRAP